MKNNLIEIFVDPSCEMASVRLNGECVMSGNYWDFHPRCHGIYEYGDFKGYTGLANAIAKTIGNCEMITKKYSYDS